MQLQLNDEKHIVIFQNDFNKNENFSHTTWVSQDTDGVFAIRIHTTVSKIAHKIGAIEAFIEKKKWSQVTVILFICESE